MFRKRLVDTADELENDYYRSPILYDPFKNTTPSMKKSSTSVSNRKLHSVMFDENDNFEMKSEFDDKYNCSLECNDDKEMLRPSFN